MSKCDKLNCTFSETIQGSDVRLEKASGSQQLVLKTQNTVINLNYKLGHFWSI